MPRPPILTVLHVHGYYWHFRALDSLCRQQGWHWQQVEFSLSKPFSQALLAGDWPRAARQLRNIAMLFRLCYAQRQTLILSMSPFDARLPFFHLLARRHTVFLHCSWAEWAAGPFPKRPKYPAIRAWWLAFFKHHCRGVFAVSMRNLETLRQFARWQVPGVVVNHALTAAFHAQGRAPLDGTLRLLYVGRMVPSKGIQFLVELAEILDPQHFQLDVVGSGPEQAVWQAACARLPHCHYLGRIDDQELLADCYRDHHVLLLPSLRTHKWQELFGMVIIEAMACGMVPICTDHVGPCEILAGCSAITHGEQAAGFLTSEQAFVPTARDICRKLLMEPNRWLVKSQSARREAERYRDLVLAERWHDLLRLAADSDLEL